MFNVIILGTGGVAKPIDMTNLDVLKENVWNLSSEEDKIALNFEYDLSEIAASIRSRIVAVGSGIGTINWIGHGNPGYLYVFKYLKISPQKAATFFEGLNPEKVVLWSCNTGLATTSGALNGALWAEYSRNGKNMRLEMDCTDASKDMNQSYANKVARHISGKNGMNIYGAMMGVMPGSISKFDMAGGPGSLVQWISQSGKTPTTSCPEYKWRYVAVVNDNSYSIVCKYEQRRRANSNVDYFLFTFNTHYST